MKLTHIDNACCIYESQGFKLLADPWLTDGAFEGSWFHYPPLVTTFDYIKDIDVLYISHLHPDHFDEKILKQFVQQNAAIPVIVLDKEPNFLKRKLKDIIGFTNIIPIKDQESFDIGPFVITMYAPFTTHPFDKSELGNFIDSAIVVESNGKVVLNANDNTPTLSSARMLKEHHGQFTVVQLKDSLAGAYPSCFRNLSDTEKLYEASRLIKRQLSAMCEIAKELETDWFQPFAGDYQLGGYLANKNKFLGVAGKKFSAEFIASKAIKPLVLNEQGSIDLITGELKATYRSNIIPYDKWTKQVKQTRFAYESEVQPNLLEMESLLKAARQKLWTKQEQLNFKPVYNISVNYGSSHYYCFCLHDPIDDAFFIPHEHSLDSFDLICYLDSRLLYRILTRKSHWNNADVGCHIDYRRKGEYNPDVHMIMSFFHT